ncbi:MAG: hypothetical protein V7L04_24090 [Nostoc sp.]
MGAISGKLLIGNKGIQMPPISKISMVQTVDKTGRLIKVSAIDMIIIPF